MHYLTFLGALFGVILAFMMYSLACHRRRDGAPAARFSGPSGTVQCLWAMLPMAILGAVIVALSEAPERPSARPAINLAATTLAAPPAAAPADASDHSTAERQ